MFLKNVRRQPQRPPTDKTSINQKHISSSWVHQSHSDLSQLTQSSNVSLYVRYL